MNSSMDRKIKKKYWTPGRIAGLAAIVVFTVAVVYKFVLGDHSVKLNVESKRLSTAEVVLDEFQEFIPITGNVLPIRTVFLDAVEGGVVEKIYVEEGQFVDQGDTLLRLGNTNLLLSILQQETGLFEQINNLRNTRLAMEQNRVSLEERLLELNHQIRQQADLYRRNQELHRQGLVSQEEFESIEYQYEYLKRRKELAVESFQQDSTFREVQIRQLEGSLERMQATMDVVQSKLKNLYVRAPISGQLTALDVEIGELKNSGQRLGQVDILDGFRVRAQIDEHYITRVFPGQDGEFTLAGSGYNLRVNKVYPEVQNGTFEVDFLFPDDVPEDIRRGQTLHIRLALGRSEEALLVRRGGFYQATGGNWIFVLDDSGDFAVKRRIRLGRQNTEYYEVLEGLEQGETVVVSSYDNYGDIEKLVLNN